MGLDIFTVIWDFLQQAFVYILGIIVLFLVVVNANPHPFFLQYFAKDAGLTVEVMHAGRGTVEMYGNKQISSLAYDYNFTKNAVYLRPYVEGKQGAWQVRRRYGEDSTIFDPVRVQDTFLLNPQILVFQKGRNESNQQFIRVNETVTAESPCMLSTGKVLRIETRVEIDGDSQLVGETLKSVAAHYGTAPTIRTIIAFTVKNVTGSPILRVGGSDPAFGLALQCLLLRKLPNIAAETETSSLSTPGPIAVRLTLEHNETLPPGLNEERLAAALLQSLEAVVQ